MAKAIEPTAILDLWPAGQMPGEAAKVDGSERDLTKPEDKLIAGERIIKLGHVATPQIHVFLPPKEKANGAAVAVCPGGGFSILAWDLEGTEAAAWLNQLGIAAAVVKYRVPTRELGEDAAPSPGDPSVISEKKAIGPLMDAQRALSLLRSHAEDWRIDPARVGVMGFSAGGQTAALAAVSLGKRAYANIDAADEATCRADFAMVIYPGGLADPETGALRPFYPVSEATPPMFFVHAADDRVTPLSSTALFTALKLAGVPSELHVFAQGGHGYGLRPTELPITQWPAQAEAWLRTSGFLGGAGDPTGSGHPPNPVASATQPSWVAFADGLSEAMTAGKPLASFSAAFPEATQAEAESVQKRHVGNLLKHDSLGGTKGAVVGEAGQKAFGIDAPLSAVLFQSGWLEASDEPTVTIREGALPGVETEIGILLGEPITKRIESIEDLKRHVRAVVPVIELPAGRHAWPNPPKPTDLVAVNVDSDHYIVGTPSATLDLDLDAIPIRLRKDGAVVNETSGGNARHGQWWNFLRQVNWAVEQGYDLKPGHLVITGALGKIGRDGVGRYEADFGPLGTIRFALDGP